MTTLVEFLAARLDEDEAVVTSCECRCDEGPQRPDCSDRVLADVGAKRAILAEHRDGNAGAHDLDPDFDLPAYCTTCEDRTRHDAAHWPCATVRALAAVYSDHPDYRKEEWA